MTVTNDKVLYIRAYKSAPFYGADISGVALSMTLPDTTGFSPCSKKGSFKKASVFAEYAILIFIIVAVIAGVTYFLKRSIQSNVKDASDTYLGTGQGLEWGSSIAFVRSTSNLEKNEEFGGDMQISATSSVSQTSLQAPVPSIKGWSLMEHKGSALHVQDAPSAATTPDYPDLEYKDWQDQGWPLH